MPDQTSLYSDLLITGAGGLLGRRLVQFARRRKYRVWQHYHRQPESEPGEKILFGDLSDPGHTARLSQKVTPDIIVNCAALADVDRCEKEIELSKRVNIDAVKSIIGFFPKAKMVHISTDYVFPGIKQCPAPKDPAKPINVYGRHKLAAENFVMENSASNLVIRMVLMFDNVDRRNFFRFVHTGLAEGRKVEGIIDQYANPISAPSAAETILDLIAAEAAGIWHAGGADYVNRRELAVKIAEASGLDKDLIIPVKSEHTARAAPRPKFAGLDVSATEKLLSRPAPDLSDELKRILGSKN